MLRLRSALSWALVLLLAQMWCFFPASVAGRARDSRHNLMQLSGNDAYKTGVDLMSVGKYVEAADMFWVSVLKVDEDAEYDITEAFSNFIQTYAKRDMVDEGFVTVAERYLTSKQVGEAVHFLRMAHESNPLNTKAIELLTAHDPEFRPPAAAEVEQRAKALASKAHADRSQRRKSDGQIKASVGSKWVQVVKDEPNNALAHSELASLHFSDHDWEDSLRHYDIAHRLSLPLRDQYYKDARRAVRRRRGEDEDEEQVQVDGEGSLFSVDGKAAAGSQFSNLVSADMCFAAAAYLRSSIGMWIRRAEDGEEQAGKPLLEMGASVGVDGEVIPAPNEADAVPTSYVNVYAADMAELADIVRREANSTMLLHYSPLQSSAVHPHMSLGFALPMDLKLLIAQSHARAESAVVKAAGIEPVRHDAPGKLRSYRTAAFDKPRAVSKTAHNGHNVAGCRGIVPMEARRGGRGRGKGKSVADQGGPGGCGGSDNSVNHDKDSEAWDGDAMGRIKPSKKVAQWEPAGKAKGKGKGKGKKSSKKAKKVPNAVALRPFSPGYRIKVGYVSANIKAKSTVYMAQDLMRFHDRSRFEVHVYATTGQDTEAFLRSGMRGVDWRAKVHAGVEHFHETAGMDVRQLAALIQSHGIHILLNWDGYSNNGVRATGLFPMQAAPIQVAHQEYIGTMGADDYIQYLIADEVAVPREQTKHYSEKMLYMPHSFLANSFAYQAPLMAAPRMQYDPSNNPALNACGRPAPASFVFCNFNKHLKFNPTLFRLWLRALQAVDESVLCLLENPADAIPHLREFITAHAPDDPSLLDRVRFQPFIPNPYDNQRRVGLMCNAILDSQIYNGHTTAGDALWAGVPIITYGGDAEMSGRVGTSALTALGLPELIAPSLSAYYNLSVRLATDEKYFTKVRRKLVATTSARSPRNPFWDLRRYVRALENGFEQVWRRFLEHGYASNDDIRDDSDGHVYAVDPLGSPTNSGVRGDSPGGTGPTVDKGQKKRKSSPKEDQKGDDTGKKKSKSKSNSKGKDKHKKSKEKGKKSKRAKK